jgi:hypothetical protein
MAMFEGVDGFHSGCMCGCFGWAVDMNDEERRKRGEMEGRKITKGLIYREEWELVIKIYGQMYSSVGSLKGKKRGR